MLSWFRSHTRSHDKARELYGAVVAQARRPEFYSTHCVPDTPEGRWELIVLHLFLLMERLQKDGVAGQALSQTVAEVFVTDMDDSMREMGVGDLTVPRKVKRAAVGLYERGAQYRAALDSAASDALTALVADVLLAGVGTRRQAETLAGYVRMARAALEATDATLASGAGTLPYPEPPSQ